MFGTHCVEERPTQSKVQRIKELFVDRYRHSRTELNYNNVYELLVAVVLSAQCTDKRVNLVSKKLFATYPNTRSLSGANMDELTEIIRSVSFFNAKARYIVEMAKQVESRFGGIIPLNQRDLMSLSGVGQKSANVVLSEFAGMNYMAVDTHVYRVSHRLGLSTDKKAIQTEKTLSTLFVDDLNILHQAFVLFGRYECKAVRPKCSGCFVKHFCITNKNFKPS